MECLKVVVISLLGLVKCRRGRAMPAVPVVTALIGQAVVIPCSTQDPPTRLSESRIYWQGNNPRRTKKDTEVLLVYNRGKVEDHLQTPLYRNRTHILPDLLRHGNFSLRIEPVKMEDDRTKVDVLYEKHSKSFELICQTAIHVVAKYSKPSVDLSCPAGAGLVKVTCMTQGGFPEPTVSWKFQNRTVFEAPDKTVKADPLTGTLSARLTLLMNASEGEAIACLVTNPALQKTVSTSVTMQSCEERRDPYPKTSMWVFLAVGILLLVPVAILAIRRARYWLTGCQNRGPSDGSAAESNAKGLELQGEDNTPV